MNSGVLIQYGDIAPEAKENFVPSSSQNEFNTLAQLQQYNLNFPNYGNPCELYQTVLDGMATAFPSVPENANLGLWSEQISDDVGTFTEPIVLELESVGQYSSQGLSLTFDTDNGIFATRLSIEWIRTTDEGAITLDKKEFIPDNAYYFCRRKVENYNKIIITFYSLNSPQNRLKLRAIDYGYGASFGAQELRDVKLIQELDPISTQISINTVDFTLDSRSNMEYSFQVRQPISVYFNGELRATTFVKKSTRKSKRLWSVQSEDYIGLLEGIPYYGGIYANQNAVDLLTDIFAVANVPYSIDDVFANAKVTGYIPFTTCREALMQVAFAIQAVVDTSNSDVVKVFALDDKVKQTIPLNRIMQGQKFTDEETVTGVEVAVHSYKPITETIDVYDANENGTGQNIFVKFSEPLHDLSITNGEIVSRETNYAIINANANCVLTGQKYEHTTQTRRKNNPVVLASEIEKVVSVNNATLVSRYNIDKLIDRCYNWLARVDSITAKIIEGKHVEYGGVIKYGETKYGEAKYGEEKPKQIVYDQRVEVGDSIRVETEYLGTIEGTVTKTTFKLIGGKTVKQCEVRR